jgi:hypothetical protein
LSWEIYDFCHIVFEQSSRLKRVNVLFLTLSRQSAECSHIVDYKRYCLSFKINKDQVLLLLLIIKDQVLLLLLIIKDQVLLLLLIIIVYFYLVLIPRFNDSCIN